jgi:hypothetical protein
MKNLLLIISLLITSLSISAQDSTQNIGRIYGEFRCHSYLSDLIDSNTTTFEGGCIWMLSEYYLYDSVFNKIRTDFVWVNGIYAYRESYNFDNLPFGKYHIFRPTATRYHPIDTIFITPKQPIIKHTIYKNKFVPNLNKLPTFIEQMQNGDTMTISVSRYGYSNTNKHFTIIKTNNFFHLTLKTDTIYTKILTKTDIEAIKAFEYDVRRDFNYISCNDIAADYFIKWNGNVKRNFDNCNLWNGCEMLKYLLFDKQ